MPCVVELILIQMQEEQKISKTVPETQTDANKLMLKQRSS